LGGLGLLLGLFSRIAAFWNCNARPEAGEVYGAIDMAWAKLVGQIAQAYGK